MTGQREMLSDAAEESAFEEDVETEQRIEPFISPVIGAIGSLLVGVGFVVVWKPSLVGTSTEYLAVYAISVVAIIAGIWYSYRRTFASVSESTPPTVEARSTTSVPGSTFDRLLRGPFPSQGDRIKARRRVSKRLRQATIDVLDSTSTDRDASSIEAALSAGTWTDDPMAGDFFAEEATERTLRDRIENVRLGRPNLFVLSVERVVGELADRYLPDRATDWYNSPETSANTRRRSTFGTVRSTGRWRGLGAIALLAIGLGAGLGKPGLLLVAGPLLLVVGYAAMDVEPPQSITIERTVEPTDPDPGERVQVRVDVHNDSGRWVPDLRIVDGVPAGMTVADGSPRHGTVLRPGASTWFEYSVQAERGTHTFESAYTITRNLSGSIERTFRTATEGDRAITYRLQPDFEATFPLRQQASSHVGRVLTDVGGSGLEFHSVREYRSGDPLSRIDWNRAAQGQGLATLQFREERSATVVLLLDTRAAAYVAPDEEAPSAVDRTVQAAADVFRALLNSDDRVGMAALSPRGCWLPPGAGHVHWARAEALFAKDPAFSTQPPTQAFHPHVRLPKLRKRLPSDAQIVMFSPLCDDESSSIARQLQAHGYPMTVISPDPTSDGTVGQTVGRIERKLRLSTLRKADARVVDWQPAERLALAFDRAQRRWSR
ncbi:DUF58 domain-containing protein [Halorhabdus salina]|uniref:DUF58 domain-containing protein n=1 Tax=Halorhabdus salina TaxID=2750670 RepID=UPI001C676E87|nr:DUF58 domain-containing protein [Halorhabdus salina]